jgi:N-acetyl-gamma-glutamyl-phosphate reductase
MNRPVVYIDGEHGTTGLQIRARLKGREDLELISIPVEQRRDEGARRAYLNEADVAILCLPDDASRAAVGLIDNRRTRVLDGSTAHRVTQGWVYGFPEMVDGQPQAIAASARVSVPGCYATAAIAMLRPLIDEGLIPADFPVSVQGVQGYSGGGRQLVDVMEGKGGEHRLAGPYRAYALELAHKHQPEMRVYSGLAQKPLFTPAVGAWRQGQLVQIPLHLRSLPRKPSGGELHAALAARYAGERFISVMPFEPGVAAVLAPEALVGTNRMEVFVFANEAEGHALVVSRIDNLGKGASGAAVQNLDLMLDLPGERTYELAGPES